jgi:hypothetical protein
MKAGLEARLRTLEQHHRPAGFVPQLIVNYVGEDLPPVLGERPLIVWVHRPGCDVPEHAGACQERR